MVNEINKPNDPLSERLAASNRQLREMQEEHRQLLEEMEVLRTRATELSRLNVQRQQLQQRVTQSSQSSEEIVSESRTSSSATTCSSTSSSMATMTSESVCKLESQQSQAIQTEAQTGGTSAASLLSAIDDDAANIVAESLEKLTMAATTAEADNDNDPETTEYLQQKIAEIAALKAQYKRVEHMVNTTNLIEQHLQSKSSATEIQAVQQIEATRQQASCSQLSEISEATSTSSSSSTSAVSSSQLQSAIGTGTVAPTTSEGDKEELLSTMLNMFNDFSDDLRGQAESLRAERERIRALKEELMVRRKGDS